MKRLKDHGLLTFHFPIYKPAVYLPMTTFQRSQNKVYKNEMCDLRTGKPVLIPSQKIST